MLCALCSVSGAKHAPLLRTACRTLPGAIVRMTTYSTGMKMIDRNVDASMPPATAVPTELRAPAPAPVAIRERQHAEDECE